ncbi:MAG: c-type cytochrome, partial [Haloferula sp.]
ESPASHDPGTAMPSVLAGLPAADRDKHSDALTSYLLSLSGGNPSDVPTGDRSRGEELYHEAGCVACHSPRDDQGREIAREGDIGLSHVARKYRPEGLTAFLYEPLKVRPDGRMPDMKLTLDEAAALSSYLLGEDASGEPKKPESHDSRLIAAGKQAFEDLDCASCHESPDEIAKTEAGSAKAPSAEQLDLSKGCLSTEPGKAPDYQLNEAQRSAIRTALSKKSGASTNASETIQLRLTQLNCIACHQRDDYGGVLADRDSYFHSTEEALGNEARIPPSLTLTGAKLRPEWTNKVLYDGERVRPYMKTRMPQYGNEALDGLTKLFGEADKLPPLEFEPPDRQSNRTMRDGANQLLGNKGLNCIACHNYNGKESPGMKGLDLMTTYQRLQPAWFDAFMRNPSKMRPGIIMPGFWPDGKAIQTEILGGSTEEQLRALWYNFSLGRSARDPSGLRVEPAKLEVTDRTRTYRGRSQVAGYRGIAVGYPGGINYAFNAQTGAFSAIWSGEFVSVGWQGQGSGNFTPSGKVVQLAQDVAILKNPMDPWPLHPKRTKENPINPDPLYPRQYGYAFEGYSMDSAGVPTFRYRSGELQIEDVSRVTGESPASALRRTLSFESKTQTNRHLRLMTGQIKKLSDTSYEANGLKVVLGKNIEPSKLTLRSSSADEKIQELILELNLPVGTTTHSFDYVLSR